MTARALNLILLLPVAAHADLDSGDHDPPPLPAFVETSAAGPCCMAPEERARILRILDHACHPGGGYINMHACVLAQQVRSAVCADARGTPCTDAHRLPVILLGLGLAMMLGFLLWIGRRGDQ